MEISLPMGNGNELEIHGLEIWDEIDVAVTVKTGVLANDAAQMAWNTREIELAKSLPQTGRCLAEKIQITDFCFPEFVSYADFIGTLQKKPFTVINGVN